MNEILSLCKRGYSRLVRGWKRCKPSARTRENEKELHDNAIGLQNDSVEFNIAITEKDEQDNFFNINIPLSGIGDGRQFVYLKTDSNTKETIFIIRIRLDKRKAAQ